MKAQTMNTLNTAGRPAPPCPRQVRAALAARSPASQITVLQLAEANRAARALGACIGCVQGTSLTAALTNGASDEVLCLAVCATPLDSEFVDPHTLELRCLLKGGCSDEDVRRLLHGLERTLGERGFRRLVRRVPAGRQPSPNVTGWSQAAVCGWRRCDGRAGAGVIWAKVLRGEMH